MILVKKNQKPTNRNWKPTNRLVISEYPYPPDIDTRAVQLCTFRGRNWARCARPTRSVAAPCALRTCQLPHGLLHMLPLPPCIRAYRVAGQASFNSSEVDVLPTNKNTTSKHVQDYNVLLESKDISNFKKARSWFKQLGHNICLFGNGMKI